MFGNLLMMSTPWMKKGRKCAFAKKKGVEFIIHLVSKSSLFFFTNFHNFNDHNGPSQTNHVS
jgi:hypothetical protein